MSLGAVAGMSWRWETAVPVHVLRVTLERLLDHLSVESSSFEGFISMYVQEVGGFQGSKA